MKKWLDALRGRSKSTASEPATDLESRPVQLLNPQDIMFTVPTISNDLPPLDAITEQPNADHVAFHEDDWCQVEFFAKARLPEIQRILAEYKAFEAENRKMTTIDGQEYPIWKNTFVRKIERQAVVPGPKAAERVASALEAVLGPAPTLFSSNAWTGRVLGGFSIQIGAGVVLCGYEEGDSVPALGAFLGGDAEHSSLGTAFGKLAAIESLILVDWRAQMVVTAIDSQGMLQVWQP